jgi:hypothetical protein
MPPDNHDRLAAKTPCQIDTGALLQTPHQTTPHRDEKRRDETRGQMQTHGRTRGTRPQIQTGAGSRANNRNAHTRRPDRRSEGAHAACHQTTMTGRTTMTGTRQGRCETSSADRTEAAQRRHAGECTQTKSTSGAGEGRNAASTPPRRTPCHTRQTRPAPTQHNTPRHSTPRTRAICTVPRTPHRRKHQGHGQKRQAGTPVELSSVSTERGNPPSKDPSCAG